MALPFHKLLQTLSSGSSIGSAAVAILASYGTDAHIYLPGIGALNGYTLGNYLESTGNTAATVDNPVGLVLDAGQAVGAERVVNGDNEAALMAGALLRLTGAQDSVIFSQGTKSAKFTADGATGTHYVNVGVIPATSTIMVSGFARLESGGMSTVKLVDTSDGSLQIPIVAGTDVWTPFSYIRQAKGAPWNFAIGNNTSETATGKSFWLDNISVKEVPGIHVSQGTTANKPILRKPSNNYYWEFDGVNDYLSLGSTPFQMADDYCVIVGTTVTDISSTRGIFTGRASGSGTPIIAQLVAVQTTGALSGYWRDDASTLVNISGGANMLNAPTVATIAARGQRRFIRRDGAEVAVSTTSLGTTTGVDTFTVGALASGGPPSAYLNGKVYPVIAIKGTVSDANLLILERWVGSLTGPTGVVIP